MTVEQSAECLLSVAELLPAGMRRRLEQLPLRVKATAEELRLRVGRPLYVVYPGAEEPIAGTAVRAEDLRQVLEVASGASVHTVMEQLKNGFIPIRGGHRLGLCGTGVVRDGVLVNLRTVSSLSLRVAREYKGISTPLVPRLMGENGLESTLILSPPGGGKTTLLRDLIRAVSSGDGCAPARVSVVDERRELAAMTEEGGGMDLGPRSDVMDSCPKEVALTALIRGMNPQVVAVDEITAAVDAEAIRQATGCGVTLLATAHARGMEDLKQRPLYRALLGEAVFSRFIVISGVGKERQYAVLDSGGAPC